MNEDDIIDIFQTVEEENKKIIKVVGVGGGGCNAASNMYREGMDGVSFCVCDTNKDSLKESPVPYKILLGNTGLGAGANPERGRTEAEMNIEDLKRMFNDGTRMAFITAGMGSGTGTGAAPLVASVAKSMDILTIGIVTLPFYFEKRRKIMKALLGLEEMRKNVDALLIINNQQICKVYGGERIPVDEAFIKADHVLCDATRSISELITITGKIDVDFRDVEATMKNGGGAIMAMGRASGEYRVEQAIENALNSPLLYGSDINKARRILFNIYTSSKHPLYVNEMDEIDAFMDTLNPDIEVIWGIAKDETIEEDAKVTILATGFENRLWNTEKMEEMDLTDQEYLEMVIEQLYGKSRIRRVKEIPQQTEDIPLTVETAPLTEPAEVPSNEETSKEEMPAVDYDSIADEPTGVLLPEGKTIEPLPSSNKFLEKMKSRFKKYLNDVLEPENIEE